MHIQPYPGWPQLMAQRDRALKQIEQTRESRDIDNPLDLGLRITFDPRTHHYFEKVGAVDFADLLGISRVEFVAHAPNENQSTTDTPRAAPKMEVLDLRNAPRCARSWKRDGTVKQRSDGGQLSNRDAAALGL